MAYQTGQDWIIAYKEQSGLGVVATGGSGLGLRIKRGSRGFRLNRPYIESEEVRRDGMTSKGRLGIRTAPGEYDVQLCLGELDTLLEAAFRSTLIAQFSITQATASLSQITVGTNTVQTSGLGSFITAGLRVGDMFQLNNTDASNNNKWLPVLALATNTITTASGVLTAVATADAAFTIIVAKSLIQGATPVERYFTFDEYSVPSDISTSWQDAKVNRIEFACQPNRIVDCKVGLLGLDGNPLATGSSPSLTSPTFLTSQPMLLQDGAIYVNGVAIVDLTGINFSLDLGGAAPDVLAPNAPDVFLNNARITGNLSGLRTDLSRFSAFDAETQLSIFLRFSENESDPADFCSIFIPNAVYSGSPDGVLGQDGPFIESLPFTAGKDERGSQYAATMIKFSTSN